MSTKSIPKYNFFILKLKDYIIPFLFLFFTICLVIFSNSNLTAAKQGLILWANSVIPSLFPFFVATELLSYTNITTLLGRVLNKFMKPVFNVRGEGSFAFIMGIISGYPVGAKLACDFRENNICSKAECERLLSFTNNSGPLFIMGTVGVGMFGSSTIGFLLFITHILACITVGMFFRFWKINEDKTNSIFNKHNFINKNISLSELGEILGKAITDSISTVAMIGGFVVIFSVIISILNSSHIINLLSDILAPILNLFNIPSNFGNCIITSILEITNGINLISNIRIKNISLSIILSAFFLGFGGISILLQVLSITSKTDLSIKPYILGKLLHGLFAALYTYLFMLIPIFNFNL